MLKGKSPQARIEFFWVRPVVTIKLIQFGVELHPFCVTPKSLPPCLRIIRCWYARKQHFLCLIKQIKRIGCSQSDKALFAYW